MAHEFLTVPELADLLRIKERKVYDLAASGLVPCTRATGKLLFPESEIRAWIAGNQSGVKRVRPAVFLGSHDPLLEWALRQSQCGLATYFDGSADGLARFSKAEGIATGLHIPDAAGWNLAAVEEQSGSQDAVLLHWAKRTRGLVVKPGVLNPASELSHMSGQRVAMRQPSSGTAVLFECLIGKQRISFEAVGPFRSEQDAVLAVANGEADVAFGLEAMAQQFDLAFVPLVHEDFDLLIDRVAFFERPMQTFWSFCRSEEFRARAGQQAGYDTENLGDVRWNA